MKKDKRQTDAVNKKTSDRIILTVIFTVLVIYSITIIFTLGWGLLTSLKNDTDYSLLKNKLGLPSLEFSRAEFLKFKNYLMIFEGFNFRETAKFYSNGKLIVHNAEVNIGVMLLNTVIYAGLGSLIHAAVTCFVAYLCAKYTYKLSGIIYSMCLVIMMIPIVGGSTSEITILRKLYLYDTFWGYFVQKFNFTGLYFFIFYAFFQSVPDSFTEAAEVDGASQLKIFLHIIVPLTLKMIATIVLISFVQLWNDYQVPLLYLPTHPTLAYGVYYMVYRNPSGPLSKLPIKIAGCMLLAIPILIIFIFLKDKLMGNISMGGLKE